MSENHGPPLLKAARLHAQLSQGALAEKLGMTRTHVSRIESGQRETPFSKIEKWLEVCGYTLNATPVGGGAAISGKGAAGGGSANIPTEALYAFLGVLRAWPQMSDRERRVVTGQMGMYAEEYGTTTRDVSAEALLAFVGAMQAWPKMTERARRVVAGQMSMYAEEYGTVILPSAEPDGD